jgi:putative tryptophan/tyrosine transport system substrate-binding protein
VDALVTDGSAATAAAQGATQTIPVVFVSGNPVAQGFARSLSHPGKNLTGVAILTGDLTPKRVQLLKEAVAGMARLAILEDLTAAGVAVAPNDARLAGNWQAIEAASRAVGVQPVPTIEVRQPQELEAAFALAVRERAGGPHVLRTRPSHDLRLVAQYYVDKILRGAKPSDLPVEQPTGLELVINLKTAKALGLAIPPSLMTRVDQAIE